jgi:hypothetical protein
MFLIVLTMVSTCMYFIPAAVGFLRHHRNENAIAVLNLCLGWTIIGWVVALVWASTDDVKGEKERMRL